MAAGVGISAAMVGTAAVISGCYDSVDVEVLHDVTGSPACEAEVIAQEVGGSTTRFASCFHAEIPTGRWIVTARQPGYQAASSELVVTKVSGCEPAVQTIALTLRPEGAPPPASIAVRPPRPGESPIHRGTLPAPASMGTGAGLPGEEAPPGANAPTGAAPSTATAAPPLPSVPMTTAMGGAGGSGNNGGASGAAASGAGGRSGGSGGSFGGPRAVAGAGQR